MAIEFNKFNNGYNNYNVLVGAGASKQVEKKEETKEVEKTTVEFKGLKDETDLLTKNAQCVYCGNKLGKFTLEDKELADKTNAILAQLGYGNYKVSAAQVASVTNNMNTVVMPGMQNVDRAAVEARIMDPNGPFADLFA